MKNITFLYKVFEIQCSFYIYNISQFGLAVFQVLNRHVWAVMTYQTVWIWKNWLAPCQCGGGGAFSFSIISYTTPSASPNNNPITNNKALRIMFSNTVTRHFSGLPRWPWKESAWQCRRHKGCGFDPCIRKIFTPVLLPRESYGQRSPVG